MAIAAIVFLPIAIVKNHYWPIGKFYYCNRKTSYMKLLLAKCMFYLSAFSEKTNNLNKVFKTDMGFGKHLNHHIVNVYND